VFDFVDTRGRYGRKGIETDKETLASENPNVIFELLQTLGKRKL
jgi:hypothetical protein